MPEINLDQYFDAYSKTPQDIKNALFADYTSAAIRNAAQRHDATEKLTDISSIVGYVLVGIIPIKNFIVTLQKEVALDEQTAKSIAYELREQVFAPVAQTLASMQNEAQRNWTQLASSANVSQGTSNKTPRIPEQSSVRGRQETSMPDTKPSPSETPPTGGQSAPPPNLPT